MKNNPDLCTNDKFLLHFQKYFVDEKPIWSEEKGRVHVDRSMAQYTGGLVTIPKDLSDGLGVGMPELAHLVIGLESVSHQHEDFIPFCVSSPMYFHNFYSLNLYNFVTFFFHTFYRFWICSWAEVDHFQRVGLARACTPDYIQMFWISIIGCTQRLLIIMHMRILVYSA